MKDDRLVRFDWAMKRLLRHKADHTVLEGFLTSLLGRPIRVVRLLESESNRESEENKHNRVDILAENETGEKLLIEVQNESEDAYFHRMLYGTSKLISEYLRKGQDYGHVSKVYSINIVYFRLGAGGDYVYYGCTEFRGLHDHQLLELPARLRKRFGCEKICDIYPEYYILKADDFDRWSKVPLDQWMYFLSTSEIPDDADAPGLQAAREQLRVDSLSAEERHAYYSHLEEMQSLRNVVEDARADGKWDGFNEGREIGREEGARRQLESNIRNMRANGADDRLISRLLGLQERDVSEII